jgi:hypothetical protein
MKMSYRTLLTGLAAAATALAFAEMSSGCASSTCADTATCGDNDYDDVLQAADSTAENAVDVGQDQATVDHAGDVGNGDVLTDSNSNQPESSAEDTTLETGNEGATTEDAGPEADASVTADADATVEPDTTVEADVTVDANGDATDSTVIPDVRDAATDVDATVIDAPSDVRADVTDSSVDVADVGLDVKETGPDVEEAGCSTTPGFSCVPVPPTNWTGPVVRWLGAYPAQALTCPSSYSSWVADGFQGPIAPNDICSCNCSASGQTCSATAQVYNDMGCATPCASVATVGSGCTVLQPVSPTCGSQGSIESTAPKPTGGTCLPHGTTVDGGAPTWTTSARLCSTTPSSAGCSSNQFCMPAPPGQFPSMCIYQTGATLACPDAGYTVGPYTYYSGANDERSCSTCSCPTPPTGGTCTGEVDLYSGSECDGSAPWPSINDGGTSCPPSFTLTGSAAGSVQGSFTLTTAGECSAGTTSPEGGVTPTGATTVCCMP